MLLTIFNSATLAQELPAVWDIVTKEVEQMKSYN